MSTRNRTAVYRDFDRLFPNFPSYLRRDAIARSIGHVSSFVTNSARYDEIRHVRMSNGMRPQKGKAPRFRHDPNIAPSFYRDNMYVPNADGTLSVKLWNGRDWTYHTIAVRSADAHYISKKMHGGWEIASPSLIRYFGHWAFAYVLRRKPLRVRTTAWSTSGTEEEASGPHPGDTPPSATSARRSSASARTSHARRRTGSPPSPRRCGPTSLSSST